MTNQTAPTPSRTALFSAAARAAHRLVDDEPYLLVDDVAERLCRASGPSPLDYQLAQPDAQVLAAARLSACARSRFAGTVLAAAGPVPGQVVVMGAGLDTTSSRLPSTSPATVWVVDRPGVLAWRSTLFRQAGLPDTARHVGADLAEGLDLDDLAAAGVELDRPVVVIWLGVSMYLRPEHCQRFFADLSGLAAGSSLVFDHLLPVELRDTAGSRYAQAVAAMADSGGEPWQCSASPDTVRAWLAEHGWAIRTDIDEADAVPTGFFDGQPHLAPMRLVRLVHASR